MCVLNQDLREEDFMFRIAICDDEENICVKIESIILDYGKRCLEKLKVEMFFSGEEICEYMMNGEEFDLIFLDIELNLINGIEVGKFIRDMLKNEATLIVYISAKDNYYQQLFDIRPMNFLHKPIDEKKIIADIEKAIDLSNRLTHVFTYRKSNTAYKRELKKILYFEAKGRMVRIVTITGEDIFYGKLKTILSQLEKYHFFCIHQSFLVNYAHITMFTHTEITMSNNEILPISRRQKEEVLEMLIKYEKEGL